MYDLHCSVKVALKMSDRKTIRICKGSSKKVNFKGWEVKIRVFLASTLDGGEPHASDSRPGKGHHLNRRLGGLRSWSGSFGEEKNLLACEVTQMDLLTYLLHGTESFLRS